MSAIDTGTEWFWRIVDADGLGDVPSDEAAALRLLCTRAARAQAAEARIAVLEAALRFYADENNYRLHGPLCGENSNFTGPDTARRALAQEKGGGDA